MSTSPVPPPPDRPPSDPRPATRRRIPPPPTRSIPHDEITVPPTTVPPTTVPPTTVPAPAAATEPVSLRIRPLDDPVIAELGHDPRSSYVEQFWVSILGPSAVLLLRRVATQLDREPDGFEIDMLDLAQELGLGFRGGKNSPLSRTIDRLCRFGLALRTERDVAIHRHVPPLTARQVDRLPPHLRSSHAEWSRTGERAA